MPKTPAKIETAPPPSPLFSKDQVELIKRQICPGASDDELKMFLWDCERSKLDPFARQIYSIERSERYKDDNGNWKTRKKRATQVSIDGFRLIAQRTGDYAGQLGPEWCGDDGAWRDVWIGEQPPAAARVAALRKDFDKPLWTTANFAEYAVTYDGKLSGQWAKMPAVMIAKCAEALALRRAFPRELSGFYTPDEMMQADHADRFDGEPDGLQSGVRDRSGPALPKPEGDMRAPAEPEKPGGKITDTGKEAAKKGRKFFNDFYKKRSEVEKALLNGIRDELDELMDEADGTR
jgi:phage recombination protein Bet